MDDYDVPPSATPKLDEVVVVNDGLPSEPETKTCWDNSVINIDEQCPIEPPPSDELCPDGITLVSAGCPPVETEQERLDREAEEARLEMERLEIERQDAESAIGAVESESGGSVELTDVLGICEGDMTNLANFEACRFVDGNSQSTFEKDDTGTTVEMWTHSTFGTKPASWFKAQGLTKPKVDVNKSRAVSTDGTYTWDSVGNVMAGPCGFEICENDPNAWSVRNRIASTTKDNVGGGQYRAPTDIQYRKDLNIWRQANFLDLQSKFGQLEIDAAKAAKDYETAQKAAAAAKTEAERIRLQKIADDKKIEADRIAQEEADRKAAMAILGDDALTSGGTGTTGDVGGGEGQGQQSASRTIVDTAIAASGVPAYSLSTGTGLESLAVKGEPTEIKQGDITWLVGGAMNVGGPVTSSGSPSSSPSAFQQFLDAGGQKGELSTNPFAADEGFIEPAKTSSTETGFGVTSAASTVIPAVASTGRWSTLFGGSSSNNNQNVTQTGGTKTTIDPLDFGVNISKPPLTKEAKDLFSGF
jgi:hypothetical protein